MDIESYLKEVLATSLTNADIACIAAGTQITIPVQSKLIELHVTEQDGYDQKTLIAVLTDLGKQRNLVIGLHWYYIEYKYLYLLIISPAPDDDADGMELIKEIPKPKPLVMTAIAGVGR